MGLVVECGTYPGRPIMDNFAELHAKGTNGANYDLDAEAVIDRLKKWDAT
jgi:hypothetical protein